MKFNVLLAALVVAGAGCLSQAPVETAGTDTADRRGIAVGEPNPNAPAPGPTRSVEGEVVRVDLERIALDGPAVVTIVLSDGAKADIHVPSFGLGLCEARASIADVYALKAGDRIEARGEASEDGSIVPCQSEDHYLRVTSK